MRENNLKVLVLLSLSLLFITCSKRVTPNSINKPIYKEFSLGVKNAYQEYQGFAPTNYNTFYRESKKEFDLYIDYKNKVLDSTKFLKNDNWMIIQKKSHNYSGQYEETYLIAKNEFIHYYLDVFSFENNKISFQKSSLELLKDEDIIEINNYFENEFYLKEKKINLKSISHPRINFQITIFKNRKLNHFKVNSENYTPVAIDMR